MFVRSSSRRSRAFVLAVMTLAATGCAVRHVREAGMAPLPPKASWFGNQRMSSGEPIPGNALTRAIAIPAAPGTWSAAGPVNVGGRLTAIAVDPNDPNHVWIGAAAGGVFESTDAGNTWTPVFDDQPVLNVGALAAHPANSDIVYVGMGEANGSSFSYDGDGVYRTLDGGYSWQHLGLAETRRIGRIAIDPGNPQRVFVAAAGGVFAPDEHRGVYR